MLQPAPENGTERPLTSANWGAESITVTLWPSVCKAKPAARPPRPAPTTSTFSDLEAFGIVNCG